jgi:bacteriocin-like protein
MRSIPTHAATKLAELTDAELDQVSGGISDPEDRPIDIALTGTVGDPQITIAINTVGDPQIRIDREHVFLLVT